MKKTIIFILAAIIIFSFVSCSESDTAGAEGTLFVEGEKVGDITVFSEYAVIPLCDVLSALEFELIWENEDVASFYCNDEKYVLSISERILFREGENDNYLLQAPDGKTFVCEAADGDLILDDNTLLCLFNSFIKYPICIEIESNSVIITKK